MRKRAKIHDKNENSIEIREDHISCWVGKGYKLATITKESSQHKPNIKEQEHGR